MNDPSKLRQSAGTSASTHGHGQVNVRNLLRRKMMQKELARRGNRMADAIPLFGGSRHNDP